MNLDKLKCKHRIPRQKRGVEKDKEYAVLTDEITRAWAGMSTSQYKRLKGLKKENLRCPMIPVPASAPGL